MEYFDEMKKKLEYDSCVYIIYRYRKIKRQV